MHFNDFMAKKRRTETTSESEMKSMFGEVANREPPVFDKDDQVSVMKDNDFNGFNDGANRKDYLQHMILNQSLKWNSSDVKLLKIRRHFLLTITTIPQIPSSSTSFRIAIRNVYLILDFFILGCF